MSGSRWLQALMIGVSALGGSWLGATWIGTALDDRPVGLATVTALALAVVAVVALPVLVAVQVRRALVARGYEALLGTVWAPVAFLAAVGVVVGVQVSAEGGLGGMLSDRGTWLVDGFTGAGPYGTAATTLVVAELAELAAPVAPDRAATLLCTESASSVAQGILEGARTVLAAPGADWALDEALERVGARLEGGAALLGVTDVVGAKIGTAPLNLGVPPGLVRTGSTRTTLSFASADGGVVEARLEGSSWRVCLPAESAKAAGTAWVAEAKAAADVAHPPPPAPDPAEAAVREVVRTVFEGRTSWALGVPAAPGFSAVFGGAAAVAEAERIRGWCRALAIGDPGLSSAVASLDARWAATPERLPLEGRAFLAEVELACAPVAGARVLVESARGVPADSEARRRLARLEGAAAAASAALISSGSGWRVVVPTEVSGAGPVLTIVPDGTTWRVESVQ